MTKISYVVEEKNRLGHIRARLLTDDPWMGLADWLLRAHKPLGFPPGASRGIGGLTLEVMPNHLPVNKAVLGLDAYFVYNGSEVRTFQLRTFKGEAVANGFGESTAHIYASREYWEAVCRMKEKMEGFCDGDIQAAYILAIFAARSPTHPFWKPIVAMRARGLSM